MKSFIGETIGTFILVFVGTGSVAYAVLFGLELWQVACIWILGVTVGIYASRRLSGAHLNPAVSLALLIANPKKEKKHLGYKILGQLAGALLAALAVYAIFNNLILSYEAASNIQRGTLESYSSACMFGEYYPNPGFPENSGISMLTAFLIEVGGTFVLMAMIFIIITDRRISFLHPLLIGITVGILIFFLAPYTQAGFNPARDFMPRIFSYFAGWKDGAFYNGVSGAIVVYVLGPFVGAAFAAISLKMLHKFVPNNKLTLGE